MLSGFLKVLLGGSEKGKKSDKENKKLTPKEKRKLEYELWVRAEEYEDEDKE
jgi:hypothetical protein